MGARHDHWIDGKPVAPATGIYLPTTDPTTREPGDEIAAGGTADVDLAANAAARAQPGWARLPGSERSEVLHRLATRLEHHAEELMELERACTGKLPAQLRLEVDMSVAYVRYYAGALQGLGGRTIDLGAANHTYSRFEPYGVVGVITPWNLPLNQAVAPSRRRWPSATPWSPNRPR